MFFSALQSSMDKILSPPTRSPVLESFAYCFSNPVSDLSQCASREIWPTVRYWRKTRWPEKRRGQVISPFPSLQQKLWQWLCLLPGSGSLWSSPPSVVPTGHWFKFQLHTALASGARVTPPPATALQPWYSRGSLLSSSLFHNWVTNLLH